MLIPKANFNCCLFIFAVTSRLAAQQQLSLVSTITADLEASARKGAQGFVFFIGNLQLQGPVSLNPAVGQGDWGASVSPKETKGSARGWGEADSDSSWIPEPWFLPEINMKNNEGPESEQLRTHPRLHLGAALKNHLEFPESQVITFKLFPEPIFGEPWKAGIRAKHNAMVPLPQEQRAPCPRHSPGRQPTERGSAGQPSPSESPSPS